MELASTLEKIVANFKEKGKNVIIGKVSVENGTYLKIDHATNPKMANIYRISGFPILYHYKKGSPNYYDGELTEK